MRTQPMTFTTLAMIGMALAAADSRGQGNASRRDRLARSAADQLESAGGCPAAGRARGTGRGVAKALSTHGSSPRLRCWASSAPAAGCRFFRWTVESARATSRFLAGMADADGMCRPLGYQLFVFVGGSFAGTLSPLPMDSRADQSSGGWPAPDDIVSADFSRFTSSDDCAVLRGA